MDVLRSVLGSLEGVPPVSLALASVAVIATVLYYVVQNKGLPPGPIGLPYFGYWFFLDHKASHLQLAEFKKKYGDVFSFTCSGRLFVNLGTAKLVREAHMVKSDNFAGRTPDYTLLSYILEEGVVFSNGDHWRTLRKFFLQLFKEHGMVSIRDVSCGPLYDCINSVVESLRESVGKEPVNITQILALKCNTILRQALFGENSVTDQEIIAINDQYGSVTEAFTPKNLLLTGMVSKYLIFPFRSDIRKALNSHKKATKLFVRMINEHKATYDEDNIRDIIDEFYKEKKKREKQGDPTAQFFTDKALLSSLVQFVGDGAVNVAAFVTMFLKKITEYPEEQEKIYQELMEVVGPERNPSVDDKSKLTYTNAFIMEALRVSDFVPYFPSMECTTETTIRGYRIPKGAITVPNMWTSHFDPEVYDEPEKFNPSRFVNADGKRAELPITFGMGKRSCLGEAFVMTQTFLFLATIIKNFRLTAAFADTSSFDILKRRIFFTHVHPRNTK